MSNNPSVTLPDLTILWCKKHWGKIIMNPSINGMVATITLTRRVIDDERFMRLCGYDPIKGTLAKGGDIQENLSKVYPLCCWVGEEVLAEVYLEASEEQSISIV